MKKVIFAVAAGAILYPLFVFARPCFGYTPDWESADERSTIEVALADFNGDGWQVVNGERKTGDGQRHVFYLEHFPALTINAVRVNGTPVPRADYCFDARAGWFSLKNAPPDGARVEVDYKWSNRLDFFAGNGTRAQTDNRDVIYFNKNGELEANPGWLSEAGNDTYTVAEADFDADGDVDVAIAAGRTIKVYKNAGNGLEVRPSWTAMVTVSAAGLAWGDVDNDGYLELAAAEYKFNGGFYVFKNNAGTLDVMPSWLWRSDLPLEVAWGDMDGDGDMDLAGGCATRYNMESGYAYVFRNNAGVLEGEPCWRNAPPDSNCDALAWGDVNGDGWLDFVVGAHAGAPKDQYEDIYFSRAGVLPTKPDWESEYYDFYKQSFLVDCDADGYLDLVQATHGLEGYFHKGGVLEKYPSWKYSAGPPFHMFSLRLGDVNADGYADVVAGCTRSSGYPKGGPNKLFLNKGNIGVNVYHFTAEAYERGVALSWEVSEAVAGFNLYRAVKSARVAAEPGKINKDLITGRSPYRYVDDDVSKGVTYQYWLEVVPLSGPAERHGPAECTIGVKASFALAQNAPNPARAATTFAFSVPTACEATIAIYDVAGRKVMAAFAGGAKPGENELEVNVSSLAPGVYTYRLEAGGEAAAKRMVVVR